MDSERWNQIDGLLQETLDHPQEERDRFLHQACAGDLSLEREVRSLLESQQAAGSFLDKPAMEIAAQARESSGRRHSEDWKFPDRPDDLALPHR